MKTAFARHRRTRLDRRSFLRGAGGVALGLPFLESLPERSAWAQSAEPVFSLFMCHSCGVVQDSFWPTSEGPLTADGLASSGQAIAALAPHAERLLVLGGISWPGSNSGCGHAQGLVQALTGARHDGGGGNRATSTAASVDTLIAEAVNPAGVDPMALYAGLKGGYINERLSFIAPGQVRSAEGNPYEVYRDIVGLAPQSPMSMPGTTPAEMQAVVDEMAVLHNSVNDLVRDQITALQNDRRLSQADRERLDRHFQGIRDIEASMTNQGMVAQVECAQSSLDAARFEAYQDGRSHRDNQEAVSLLHMELAAFAFACNLNRTASLQVGDGTDATVYDVPSNGRRWGFHHISHRVQSDGSVGNDSTAVEAHKEIDVLRMETLKQGIDAFASYTTATGTLLDHAFVLWTNHVSDGPSHSFQNVPTLIVGNAGGYLRQGEYLQFGNGNLFNNPGITNDRLLNTLKTAAGVPGGEIISEIVVG